MRKPVIGFPTRSDTNRAVDPQLMARGLKFWSYGERDCTIYVAKTKGFRSAGPLFSHLQKVGFFMMQLICSQFVHLR